MRARIEALEQRIRDLEGQRGANAPTADSADTAQRILEKLDALESRLGNLESSAVLSEPETRVKRKEIYVDKNGNEYDQPVEGARPTVTYERERVFRRQTISEKIEEAISGEEEKKVQLGLNSALVVQHAVQTGGADSEADGHSYALASADLLFSAKLAQNTTLFADVVGLSGAPPDGEIGGLTLLNSYTARLVRQNELNLREAWIRTELFDQKLALVGGRLDLTSIFDRNTAANDESSQFISDALVNNPLLGLSSNGTGLAAIYDPKGPFNFKLGAQQSNPDATNLSQSLYTLGEIGYRARPSMLGEGNYRVWYRTDNSSGSHANGYGISLDQKLNSVVTLFGRYGRADADDGHDNFISTGLQFQNRFVLNPLDYWGVGYSRLKLATEEKEDLAEAYYNLHLSEKLRLSFHLQYVSESGGGNDRSFLLPGLSIQAGL